MAKLRKSSHRALTPTAERLLPLEKAVYLKLRGLKPRSGELEPVVVAVSGGVDSICLLHILARLASRLRLSLTVVHVNHAIRGLASNEDAAFVKREALALSKQGLPVSAVVHKLTKFKGKNFSQASEDALRKARYEVLFSELNKIHGRLLFVAHHKDDLLETRLIRLLQGVGVPGLKAMEFENSQGIIRPFLNFTRQDLLQYAKARALRWRNDATNSDTRKLRNWVRRNWLGLLRRDHSEYVRTLFDSLDRLARMSDRIAQIPSAGKGTQAISVRFPRMRAFDSDLMVDHEIFVFLKGHASRRVTSRHVQEFKKHLRAARTKGDFRMAGTVWRLTEEWVSPLGTA